MQALEKVCASHSLAVLRKVVLEFAITFWHGGMEKIHS